MTCQSRPYLASCARLIYMNPANPFKCGRARTGLQQQADDLPVEAVLCQLRQAETHIP